jgi:hypothetical protein
MSAAEVLDLTDHWGCEEATEVLELAGPWWENARCCRGGRRVSGMFLSEKPRDIAHAKRICAACPVMAPCIEGVLV